MSTWRDGWFIFIKDLKSDRYHLIYNVIFMLYLGGMTILALNWESQTTNPILDYYLLLIVPYLGFFFSRKSFRYLKNDSYTKMLYYYRMLPIPAIAIIKGRIISLIFASLFNSLIYFSVYFGVMYSKWGAMKIQVYLAFVFTCLGYCFLISGIYIYVEFLKKGTVYLWITIILNMAFILVAFVISHLGWNLTKYVMQSSQQGLLSPIMWGSLVISSAALWGMCRITLRKLSTRDLI
ncbi:hypothetical protein J2Z69_002699 [Paenibacillus shirakamiensis]|uniref:ABC-2 transporter permease n=1 Tax=Paenibacillus shirakamiensis TaxID=1265935 RepID=A0ABS4JIW6_9BACL|nr:hypothetical protein [Paenibacillus shirakamiensis]MBP2001654.1 hypothetical protein [Paenibacillus shirakamiensis]